VQYCRNYRRGGGRGVTRDSVPKVYDALKVNDAELALEEQQQPGDGVVRTIAMGFTDGVKRGLGVINSSSCSPLPE